MLVIGKYKVDLDKEDVFKFWISNKDNSNNSIPSSSSSDSD